MLSAEGIVMILNNFRRKLRKEALLWREEGLIGGSQYNELSERYQFNNLETVESDRFVFILIAVGSILLGLGVITFVAANWQAWSKEVKFTLLLSLFLAVNITGFHLWKQPNQNNIPGQKPRQNKKLLGHGLLIFGAFILGATMTLLAQMFQMNGSGYEILLAWGFGVLLMAYSLRLTSLGILGIILVQIGYWTGLGEWYSQDDLTWARLVVQHMPLISAAVFIPLAYWCRSRWIFTLGAIAVITSLQFNLKSLEFTRYPDVLAWIPAIAFTLPPALLWSYDDLLFPRVNFRAFSAIARTLALIFFSILFFILSFRWWWEGSTYIYQSTRNASLVNSFPLIDVAILSALAIWQWFYLLSQRHNRRRRELDPTTIAVGGFIILTALVTFWHLSISPIPAIGITVFNSLLAIFAFGLIREALELGERQAFWGGMILLALQIISRMLEYDTGLLFKSFVFVLCGIAVIIAGLWFERHSSGFSRSSEGSR